jgi:hypothetical protein
MSAMAGNQPKELSVQDLVKQELMAKLLTPAPEMDPLAFLTNMNPYG